MRRGCGGAGLWVGGCWGGPAAEGRKNRQRSAGAHAFCWQGAQAVAGANTNLMSLSETVMRTGTASGWARRAEESRSWPAVREMVGCRDSRATEEHRERQVGLV